MTLNNTLSKNFQEQKSLLFRMFQQPQGQLLPIKEITAMAHLHGVSVVIDGAQAFGTDVNVTDLGVDAYATSAHKWILAPTGNGILFVKSNFQKHIYATVLDSGVSLRTVGTRPKLIALLSLVQ